MEAMTLSESYQRPTGGEPTRPLPPYRPAGPLAGVGAQGLPTQAAHEVPVHAAMYSPVPSQSTMASAPPPPPPPPTHAGTLQPQGTLPVAAYRGPSAHGPSGPTTFTPAPAASANPGGPAPVQPTPPSYGSPAARTGFPTGPVTAPTTPAGGLSAGAPPASGGTMHPSSGSAASEPGAARAAAKPAAPRASRVGMSEQHGDELPLDDVLREMVRIGASDVHLTTGVPPMVRVSGTLHPLEQFGMVLADPLRRTLYGVLTQKQREKFEEDLELDLSYAVRGLARFRVNIYQQRESIGAAFRVIPYEIKPLEALGIPPIVATFAGLPRGLVLVTGPTGSGKSTTLAAIVDLANRTREDHIMTVEDPIEFLHRHKKCLVNQREVGADTHSFANALKHVLRQDPDIILVGEMRDLETISVALTAAETGHLVFATLHTQDAAQTIDRIIDVFPAHQQSQVRTQLAGTLQGVVCQTLCKRADQPGRAVATEVLVATPAIRNLIREGKTHQIYSSMQAGAQQGMHTIDQHLSDLVRTGKISYETGLEKCQHVEDFNRLTGRSGGTTQGAAAATYGAAGF